MDTIQQAVHTLHEELWDLANEMVNMPRDGQNIWGQLLNLPDENINAESTINELIQLLDNDKLWEFNMDELEQEEVDEVITQSREVLLNTRLLIRAQQYDIAMPYIINELDSSVLFDPFIISKIKNNLF